MQDIGMCAFRSRYFALLCNYSLGLFGTAVLMSN